MIAIPAIDLREGACVQLVGGAYDEERVRLDDPVAVAREWARLGFSQLHVVDLDAATGRGSNLAVVRAILREGLFDAVQVGGGVRDEDGVEALLDAGSMRVVVGTRALEDPDWLADACGRYPGALIVAADVKGRRVVTRGWERTLVGDIVDRVEALNALPLAGIMVTAVHREGQMEGPDYHLMDDVLEAATLPVVASGGVGAAHQLRDLAERGVAATVLGMALYTGALDPRSTAEEFGA